MTERIQYYDSLRGIAIIGVVLIHTLSFRDSTFFETAIFLRQSINFAVPLFLGISGFFLVKKEIRGKKEYFSFLKKHIKRVYIPYLFWSVCFFIFYVVLLQSTTVLVMLKRIVLFQSSPIFYFVALIIQFYILLPFLKKKLKKLVIPSVIISLLACAAIFLYKYLNHTSLPLLVYAGNFLTWGMFFLLGMYLGTYKLKINSKLLWILVICALGISTIETYFQYQLLGNINEAVTAVKISSFLYSGLLLILLLNKPRKWTVFSGLGKTSYAIYLMHLLVLPVLHYFFNDVLGIQNFGINILVGGGTLLICYYSCIVVRQISPKIAHKFLGI